MYCTSLLFQCIWLQNLHTPKKVTLCHHGVFAAPGNMLWIFCVNQLFINLGIPSDHCLFSTNSATNLMLVLTQFIPDITMPLLIKKMKNFTAVHISWFVYHLVSLAKFTHTKEVNICFFFHKVARSELSLDLKQSCDSAVTTSWGSPFQSGMVLGYDSVNIYL